MFVKKLTQHPSDQYRAVLGAVTALATAEGIDIAERACAEAVIPFKYKAFVERCQVEEHKGSHVCEERLKGHSRCPETPQNLIHLHNESLPAADHLAEWEKDGKTTAITSQPYGISFSALKAIVRYCEQNNFEAEIDAGSWWFPGRTVLIVFTKVDLD